MCSCVFVYRYGLQYIGCIYLYGLQAIIICICHLHIILVKYNHIFLMTLQHQPQIGALHLDGSPQPVCPSMGNVPQAEGIAPRRSKRKFHKEIVETDKPERGHVIQEMIFKMPFLPDRSHINTARLTRLALSRKVSSAPRHKEKWHPKSSFEEATLGTHCFWNKVIPVAPDPDYKTQSSVPQRQSAALSSSPSLSTSATGADCSCSSLSSADMLVSQT